LLGPIMEVRWGDADAVGVLLRNGFPDGYDTIKTGERKRAEDESIDVAEDRRICADPESQGQDGDGCEGRVLAELSKAEAAIGDHRVQPIANSRIAYLFFYLFDTAKFDPRGSLRFLRRHTRTNIFLYQHPEVRTNLLVEFCMHTSR